MSVFGKMGGRILTAAVLLLMLFAGATVLSRNAFRGFNFFDMGSFLDASWRVFCGQAPYADFIFIAGPVHLWMNAFFFVLFGFGKAAVLAHLVAVQSIVILATFFIASRFAPAWAAVLAAALSMVCFYWPISHPWYDQSAHFWGILGTAFLARRIPAKTGRHAFWTGWVCAVLGIISLMTKANIGAMYFLTYGVVLLFGGHGLAAAAGFLAGAGAATGGFLILLRCPGRFFEQTIAMYGRSNLCRFNQFADPRNWLFNFYWVPFGIVFVNFLFRPDKIRFLFPFFVLFAGVSATALVSTLTGSMNPAANFPLWGIQVALALTVIGKDRETFTGFLAKGLYWVSLAAIVGTAVFFIKEAIPHGRNLTVWRYAGINPDGDYEIRAAPFRGWRCRRAAGEILDDMTDYVRREIPAKDSLLVLGDMQILYPLTGRESYRGIPFIFDVRRQFPLKNMPMPGAQTEEVRRNIFKNPPDWVIAYQGPSQLETNFFVDRIVPRLGLSAFFEKNYDRVKKWGPYVLFKKKRAAS